MKQKKKSYVLQTKTFGAKKDVLERGQAIVIKIFFYLKLD